MYDMREMEHYLGLGQDVLFKLGAAIGKAGGDPYYGLRLLTKPEGQPVLAQLGAIIADHKMAGGGYIKKVGVERRINLKQAMEPCCFDEVDPQVETLFSLPESPGIVREVVPISILCFDYEVKAWGDLNAMVAQLKEKSYRPATLGELLALAETKEYRLGATFALGTVVEKYPGPKLICYLDEHLGDWDQGKQCRVGKKCLKVANADHLAETIGEIRQRNKDNHSERSWLLAVRE